MSKQYGYVRASSADQNEDRQMAEMEKATIQKNNIHLQFMPKNNILALWK